MKVEFTTHLDTSGLSCPEPVWMLHSAIRDAAVSDIIKVVATDPATLRDIPQFCSFLGHSLLHQEQDDHAYIFFVQKGDKR